MYTSYATATAISKNTPIQIKTDFTPLSGTVSFDGFKTTYDIAKTDLATANSKNSNFMTSGTITVTLSGISSKLDFVESVTFFDGDTEFTLKDKSKSGNTYTFNVGESYTHNDVGPRTLTAKVNFKSPVSSSTNINGETIRHITGLPAVYTKQKDYTNNGWNCKASDNSKGTYSLYNSSKLTSPAYYFPESTNIVAKLTISPSLWTSGTMFCGGQSLAFSEDTSSLEFNLSLNGYNSLEITVKNNGSSARFTQLNQTTIHYR